VSPARASRSVAEDCSRAIVKTRFERPASTMMATNTTTDDESTEALCLTERGASLAQQSASSVVLAEMEETINALRASCVASLETSFLTGRGLAVLTPPGCMMMRSTIPVVLQRKKEDN
jgi:hypothetical protein